MSAFPFKSSARGARGNRVPLIRQVNSLLGFFVLTLLISESMLCLVLTLFRFSSQEIGRGVLWTIVIAMIGLFVLVVGIVTVLSVRCPEILIFTADQRIRMTLRRNDLEPSALRDAINAMINARLVTLGLTKAGASSPPRELGKESSP